MEKSLLNLYLSFLSLKTLLANASLMSVFFDALTFDSGKLYVLYDIDKILDHCCYILSVDVLYVLYTDMVSVRFSMRLG